MVAYRQDLVEPRRCHKKLHYQQVKYLHQIESYIILFKNVDLQKYFNSGSKKRELSSKTSTSGDDPKMIHDGSLDNSNIPDGTFTEALFSPDCVKIL